MKSHTPPLLTWVEVIHREKLGNMRRLDGILALHLEAISRLKFQMREGWYESAAYVCVSVEGLCLLSAILLPSLGGMWIR
jgi:hypothetical protein